MQFIQRTTLVFSGVGEVGLPDYPRYRKGPGHLIALCAKYRLSANTWLAVPYPTSCSLSVQPLRGYFSALKSVTTPAFAFCLLKSIELFQLWLLSLSAVLGLAELWEGKDKQV